MDIASGAVLISATTEYDQKWAGMLLLDRTPGSRSVVQTRSAVELGRPGVYGTDGTGSLRRIGRCSGFSKTCQGCLRYQLQPHVAAAERFPDREGCYDWDNGWLTGITDGRVIRFQWTEDGPQIGSAAMVLTSDGNYLNGLWYENGRYQGLWHGTRVMDSRMPKCQEALESDKKDAIGKSLDEVGRAILYSIYFDYDKATIRPDSEETLKRVSKAIKSRPNVKLVIEGHIDPEIRLVKKMADELSIQLIVCIM